MNHSATSRTPTIYIVRSLELLRGEVFDNRENTMQFESLFSDAAVGGSNSQRF